MKSLLSNISLSLVLALLAGCGFHLRGSIELPAQWENIYLASASPNSELSSAVRDGFQSNGISVDDRSTANYVLYLGNEQFERRNLTIGNNSARAAEFELEMSTSLRVTASGSLELMEETRLTTSRVMTHDPDNVTGKEEESRLLRREMRRELVQQVLRQIRFLATRPATAMPVDAMPTAPSSTP